MYCCFVVAAISAHSRAVFSTFWYDESNFYTEEDDTSFPRVLDLFHTSSGYIWITTHESRLTTTIKENIEHVPVLLQSVQ